MKVLDYLQIGACIQRMSRQNDVNSPATVFSHGGHLALPFGKQQHSIWQRFGKHCIPKCLAIMGAFIRNTQERAQNLRLFPTHCILKSTAILCAFIHNMQQRAQNLRLFHTQCVGKRQALSQTLHTKELRFHMHSCCVSRPCQDCISFTFTNPTFLLCHIGFAECTTDLVLIFYLLVEKYCIFQK